MCFSGTCETARLHPPVYGDRDRLRCGSRSTGAILARLLSTLNRQLESQMEGESREVA